MLGHRPPLSLTSQVTVRVEGEKAKTTTILETNGGRLWDCQS